MPLDAAAPWPMLLRTLIRIPVRRFTIPLPTKASLAGFKLAAQENCERWITLDGGGWSLQTSRLSYKGMSEKKQAS
jgi:hypothetical protein